MRFSRGDIVLAVAAGDYGKPRPCLVIQSDLFAELPSVTVCPLTSDVRDDAPLLRLTVEPEADNGLKVRSQIAIDKVTTLSIERARERIGVLSDLQMLQVTRSLAVFLGLA